jgi:hypothetical protein
MSSLIQPARLVAVAAVVGFGLAACSGGGGKAVALSAPGAIASQPASAFGIVSARRGNEVILSTAAGLDRLTLAPTTTVAKLIDADPASAVTGARLTAEGSSLGGILDVDSASLGPPGVNLADPPDAPAGGLTVETGSVVSNTGGLITLQTATGEAAVWLGLAKLTTVVPGTAAEVDPGTAVVAYGPRSADGTLTANSIDLLLTS